MDWPTLNAVKRLPLRKLWDIYPRLPLTNGYPELREIVEAIERRIFATPELERDYLEHRHKSTSPAQAPFDLKAIREERKWTQERMAVELDVSRSTYAMAEAGKRALPAYAISSLSRLVCHSPRLGYRPPRFCDKEIPCFKGAANIENRGSQTACDVNQEREAA